jgi:acetoin utilization deacetylase AcuC-like enzyme
MKIIHSDEHRTHFAQGEIYGGEFVTPFERPSRVEYILRELKTRKMTDIVAPGPLDMRKVRKVHDKGFLEFLENAWSEWVKAGYRGEIVATVFPARSMRQLRPKQIDGKVGYYTHSVETCITAGTWDAARASAAVALTGQKIVASGAGAAFALCRPPGHHAHDDLYGGYCFLNNAAIAAQAFRDSGADRVAILDVDFITATHPGYFLRAQGRAVLLAARRSGRRIRSSRLQGRDRRGAGEGYTNYPCRRAPPWRGAKPGCLPQDQGL